MGNTVAFHQVKSSFNYHVRYCNTREANERALAELLLIVDSGARWVISDWDRRGGKILRRALEHATEGRRTLPRTAHATLMVDFMEPRASSSVEEVLCGEEGDA